MTPAPEPRTDFAAFARGVKVEVDERLARISAERVARAEKISPDVGAVVASLFDLVTRGGKRVRPALVSAAHVGCSGGDDRAVTIAAGAALEVLHAYLLVHDDWMDGDDVRRGGPSAHAALRSRFGSTQDGDACAILAGDFGQAVAFEILATLEAPPDRVRAAVAEVSRMLADVVCGQVLDVRKNAVSRADVEKMHRLKTSSYTTTTPLVLGAILAGADARTQEALRDVGEPLGVAFQLADDLLGTFGDPARTGKSCRSDLRSGKRTALVAELEDDRASQLLLPRVLGVVDAPDEEVDALIGRLVDSGAKARVEARIDTLLGESRKKIEALSLVLPLSASLEGKSLLLGAVDALGKREH